LLLSGFADYGGDIYLIGDSLDYIDIHRMEIITRRREQNIITYETLIIPIPVFPDSHHYAVDKIVTRLR